MTLESGVEFLDLLNFWGLPLQRGVSANLMLVIAGEDRTIILFLCFPAQEEFQVAIFRKGLPLSEWKRFVGHHCHPSRFRILLNKIPAQTSNPYNPEA